MHSCRSSAIGFYSREDASSKTKQDFHILLREHAINKYGVIHQEFTVGIPAQIDIANCGVSMYGWVLSYTRRSGLLAEGIREWDGITNI